MSVPDPTTWSGYRRHTIARSTGTLVVLVDALVQGCADLDDEGRADRWALICDPHGCLCTWPTQRAAASYLAHPEEWCEECLVEARALAKATAS